MVVSVDSLPRLDQSSGSSSSKIASLSRGTAGAEDSPPPHAAGLPLRDDRPLSTEAYPLTPLGQRRGSSASQNGPIIKEGGYGWVVTACSFTLTFLFAGTLYSWGIFQADLARRQVASALTLSAVGALQTFFQAIGCMPATLLVTRLGQPRTAALGMGLSGLSFILASFTTHNIGGLIFLQGIFFGLSGSLVYLTAFTAPSHWFIRWRGLSTGIASCGGGLGGAAFAIMAQRLLQDWGMAWAYRFFGALMLVVGVPVGLMLRSGPIHSTVSSDAAPSKHILRSSRFVRTMLACFIASYPFFIPPYYISQYAQSVGQTAAQGALYSALFNIASAVGRIGFGVLADTVTGYINAWSMSILVIALSSLLVWPYAIDQPLIILFVCMCGLGSGGFFTLQASVVAQILGIHRLERGIGWLEISASFGFLAGPLSAGALLDAFGGTGGGSAPYRPVIYLVGGTTALAWLIIVSVRLSSSRTLWKRV